MERRKGFLGSVVLLTDVGADHGLEAARLREAILIFGKLAEKSPGIFVAEMAFSPTDPLLEVPWIRTIQQQINIVVRLEHQRINVTQRIANNGRDISKVSGNRERCSRRSESKHHRVGRIVRDSKWLNQNISDNEGVTRAEDLDSRVIELRQALPRTVKCSAVHPYRQNAARRASALHKATEASHVIRMLMGDKNSVDCRQVEAKERKPLLGLTSTQPTVEKYPR